MGQNLGMADPINSDLPDAEFISTMLGLEQHPEGGRFSETWRDESATDRPFGTAIYFLLTKDERSHWHRVDAAEIWHFYAGAPLELETVSSDDSGVLSRVLGNDLRADQRPQLIVEAHQWQSARSLGAWTLVGCTVSPGFDFEGFELAPDGWTPDPGP